MSCKTILNENKAYWSQRAGGYSEVNRLELGSRQRARWRAELCGQIAAHFPGRAPESLRVLDVGTGPGFFAILLAEAGYRVTAIDLTPEMLAEARRNAGALAARIDFREMNAEETAFPDGAFDVIVTRNLTWNLPHPEKACREWARLLRRGGLLLNFDANWYGYLFDADKRAAFAADRDNSAAQGIGDQNVGENFDVMEDIARRVPLSNTLRPQWDIETLTALGLTVSADEGVWERVWSAEEKINFASTPLFLVAAAKEPHFFSGSC